MTSGSPAKLIFGFAIPMFLGLLFQQFYSMVDTLIVGKFLGVNPLAGVGSTTSLNFMVLGFCMGVCNGFAIPVAQMFGAKEEHRLRRYVTNGAWLCIVFSIVMTLVVVAVCRPVLVLMQTPEEIFEYAYVYIVIVFWGIPCTFLYNILAAIIRSLGDSKTPVIFLAISSGINIVLDLVFVLVFDMGVEGPAIATVLAQGISGIICLWYMYRKFPVLHASREEWRPEFSYMGKLCYIGIPMGLQYSVTAIGTLVLQAAVNGLGAAVVAGVTAGQKINAFIQCPLEALGQTMAPYAGQNMGAEKYDRIGKGLKSAVGMGFAVSVLCSGDLLWKTADHVVCRRIRDNDHIVFLSVSSVLYWRILPADSGKYCQIYYSGNGILYICDTVWNYGNDCTNSGRVGRSSEAWVYRNLSGPSHGMAVCRCVPDPGIFLVQEKGGEARIG